MEWIPNLMDLSQGQKVINLIFIAFACPYVLTVPVTNVSGVPTSALREYKAGNEGLLYTALESV